MIGSQLLERRKRLGATRDEVARRAATNGITIYRIETGRTRNPGHHMVMKLLNALDAIEAERAADGAARS